MQIISKVIFIDSKTGEELECFVPKVKISTDMSALMDAADSVGRKYPHTDIGAKVFMVEEHEWEHTVKH